jgi:hypothetical protein
MPLSPIKPMSESEFSSLRIAYLNAGLSISDDAILSKCMLDFSLFELIQSL